MSRSVRFIVHQRIRGESRRVGLFTAAYHLLKQGDLDRQGHQSLGDLLSWFEAEPAVPPRGSIPDQALFWFADAGPFSRRMWELAQVLNDHGFTTELVTARFVGRVVYRDPHQLAAVPPQRRRRGA